MSEGEASWLAAVAGGRGAAEGRSRGGSVTTLTRAECYFAPRRHRHRQLGKWVGRGKGGGGGWSRTGEVEAGGCGRGREREGAGHSAGRAVILN